MLGRGQYCSRGAVRWSSTFVSKNAAAPHSILNERACIESIMHNERLELRPVYVYTCLGFAC